MANLDFFSLYKNIIAIPSISSTDTRWDQSNEAVIRLLADWFGQLGFQCEVTALPDLPGKFNLVATYGQGEGGLLLAGHTDTVPFDEGAWTKDPFKVTEEGNRLYGLGTIDMKGFFAFIVEALKEVDLKTLSKPLRILATADEETTMAGARAIAAAAELKPDYAVIGEPTGLVPVVAHKGHMSEAIRITGGPAHSAVWMQMLADVSGLPVELPQVEETGCFGAAIAALVGTGIYQNFSDAQQTLNYAMHTLTPDMNAHAAYQRKYHRYQLLISALQGYHARVKEYDL